MNPEIKKVTPTHSNDTALNVATFGSFRRPFSQLRRCSLLILRLTFHRARQSQCVNGLPVRRAGVSVGDETVMCAAGHSMSESWLFNGTLYGFGVFKCAGQTFSMTTSFVTFRDRRKIFTVVP